MVCVKKRFLLTGVFISLQEVPILKLSHKQLHTVSLEVFFDWWIVVA